MDARPSIDLRPRRSRTWIILYRLVQLIALFLVYDAVLMALLGLPPSRRTLGWEELLLVIQAPFVAFYVFFFVWQFLEATAISMTACIGIGLIINFVKGQSRPVYVQDLAMILTLSVACGLIYSTLKFVLAMIEAH